VIDILCFLTVLALTLVGGAKLGMDLARGAAVNREPELSEDDVPE
jgi:hypothetical protein